ncbi:leucyl aminopeptidase family protein [Legionella jamestowniensis]|uniref:Leucine aminopeptidase n=1 Tax=Legionella jamestowniensis TaxID=455 RepID=A0A0W0ULC3_9GAMM|nr:leucyl aminopeptidase family protein [Legionella jamestowniensis]KTD08699.1 leucine aminopeptidase [Legionella jamestowniensis]OCH96861.1 leucyl aminopeptidase [Legionella jamestowniensis]SFL55200.1 leucyl aminopeptidase [Legionella jamestowniensis DSM 19215]
MHANLFYDTCPDKAISLHLISQTEWETESRLFTTAEFNFFSLQEFKAKAGEICLITNSEGTLIKAYVGTGNNEEALALACAATKLPPASYQLKKEVSSQTLVAWALAQYRFTTYKQQDIIPKILIVNENILSAILADVEAIFLVRHLINTPTNDLGPEELAAVVEDLAEKNNAAFQQWVGNELLSANFPAIHAVGRASAKAPRLIALTWGDKNHPKVTLVGKGVCFDSGGLDIKPSTAMRLMKKDMGGAAHVIGLAQWIMQQQLPIYLQVFIPAVENAIGPDAFRPGDILTMRNGLTVEVDNTDAEGRLILADAIVKACEEPPELLIDFSTLTGAARVAVGTEIAALFSNDDQLAQSLAEASINANDPVWRLPLFAGYSGMLDSTLADMANASSSPYAGAITAALFLQRFIPESVSWAHFDVMAWNVSSKPGRPEGGEAMGLRAVAYYLSKKYGD